MKQQGYMDIPPGWKTPNSHKIATTLHDIYLISMHSQAHR